jgi:heme exporter protein B
LNFFRQAWTIAWKDLRSEVRSKETLNASLSFAIVILLMFSFAFEPDSEQTREIAGGLLWLVFAFAGALVFNRSFARDLPNDCLDALIASPVPGSALFLGKTVANFVLLFTLEVLCFPVFGIFYNVRWTDQLGQLTGVVLLATWGMSAVGTIFSALTVNLRLKELMLPMLMYPIMIPGLLGAIRLSTSLIAGQPIAPDDMVWLQLLVVVAVVYTLLGVALVDVVLLG